jgi:hypothetical protein
MDMELFHDTGLPSKKVFMLPDKTKIPATKMMRLKHNLRAGAGKMNIVPNLHSSLISVSKMAEHGYIAVFDKKEARIYDETTTTITTSGEPIIVAPRCDETGLWKMNLDLDYKILGHTSSNQFIAGVDVANTIYDLPNSHQLLRYFHAAAGFPTKESFTDAVRAGNYATWPGLTTTLISKHFPDSDETQKRRMKGQRKGVSVGKMRVPVRHLSSSKLECRPNELARGHFGRASKYSVAINSFVYFIS